MTVADLIKEWETIPADPVKIMQFVMRIPLDLLPEFTLWAFERMEQLNAIADDDVDLVN